MLNAIGPGLRGALEIVLGREHWREAIGRDERALIASFLGPLIVMLFLSVSVAGAIRSQIENGLTGPPPEFWPTYGGYLAAYAAKTLIILAAAVGYADILRAQEPPLQFVAAHNWMSALIANIQAAPFALYILGAFSLETTYSFYLLGLAFSCFARWRCAREALGVDRQVAVAVVAAEILLYLFAIDAFDNVFGLTQAAAEAANLQS